MIPVVRSRFWSEVALWFAAERILVVGDALGTVGYFRAPGEPVGVHPFLRFKPPRRAFAGLEPLHVLCGHGQGGHGEGVPDAVRQALATPGAGFRGPGSTVCAKRLRRARKRVT